MKACRETVLAIIPAYSEEQFIAQVSWQIGKMCKVPVPDSQCGFRLVRRELLPVLMGADDRFGFETESIILAARYRFRIGFVPIRTIYASQHSKIRPLLDTLRYVQLIRKYCGSAPVKQRAGVG